MTDCPKCGYPTKGNWKGLYIHGEPCPGCGYRHQLLHLDELLDETLKKPEKRPLLARYMASYLEDSLHRYPVQERLWISRAIKILRSFSQKPCEPSSAQEPVSSS